MLLDDPRKEGFIDLNDVLHIPVNGRNDDQIGLLNIVDRVIRLNGKKSVIDLGLIVHSNKLDGEKRRFPAIYEDFVRSGECYERAFDAAKGGSAARDEDGYVLHVANIPNPFVVINP